MTRIINALGTSSVGQTGSGPQVCGTGATLTNPTLITPALGTPSSGDLSNCTGVPVGPLTVLDLSNQTYSTGTISQSDFTVVGTGTTFTSDMVGGLITYPNGDTTTVIGFVDTTTLTVIDSLTESDDTYTLKYTGIIGTKAGYFSYSGSLIYLANEAGVPALMQPNDLGSSAVLLIRGSNSITGTIDGGHLRLRAGSSIGGTGGNVSLEGGTGPTAGNANISGANINLVCSTADGQVYIQSGSGGLYLYGGGEQGSMTLVTDGTGTMTLSPNAGLFLTSLTSSGGDYNLYIDSITNRVYKKNNTLGINYTQNSNNDGTAALSGSAVTGTGTSFSGDMVGGTIVFTASGHKYTIQSVSSTTDMLVTSTGTEGDGAFTVHFNGVTLNADGSIGAHQTGQDTSFVTGPNGTFIQGMQTEGGDKVVYIDSTDGTLYANAPSLDGLTGTPDSIDLTNGTNFPTLNQDTTGNAATADALTTPMAANLLPTGTTFLCQDDTDLPPAGINLSDNATQLTIGIAASDVDTGIYGLGTLTLYNNVASGTNDGLPLLIICDPLDRGTNASTFFYAFVGTATNMISDSKVTSRGTMTNPEPLLSGDILYALDINGQYGATGISKQYVASIRAVAEADFTGPVDCPTRLSFYTSTGGGGTFVEGLRIASNGAVTAPVSLSSPSLTLTTTPLAAGSGGTGSAFVAFTGASSTVKTYTLPNNNALLATVNAVNDDWTPVDASGADVEFTVVGAHYSQTSVQVTFTAELAYGATANTDGAEIGGLPAPASGQWISIRVNGFAALAIPIFGQVLNGETSFSLYNEATGVPITNVQLTGKTIYISGVYSTT